MDPQLKVGTPIARDDGRFYVPVSIAEPLPGKSAIVFRVSSDAFDSVSDAEAFALEVAAHWNAHSETGYMCTIAYEDEFGWASGGTPVYSSLEDLKRQHACWESCGVTEVAVSFKGEIIPQNLKLFPLDGDDEEPAPEYDTETVRFLIADAIISNWPITGVDDQVDKIAIAAAKALAENGNLMRKK